MKHTHAPWLWRACVVLVGLLGLNCRDATGPRRAGGQLALLPTFESRAASQIDFDRMRVTLEHPGGGTVLDTVIAIPATADTIDVSLRVPLTSSSEEMLLYLRLINAAGDTVLRNDPYPQPVTVTAGGTATTVAVTIRATVASIAVTPVEVALSSLGATQQFTAVALDQNGNPLATQPTNFRWSSSVPAVAVVDTATGIATAVANGTTTISATTSGVSGSTVVTVNQVAIQLAFTTPPSTAAAGVVISPPVAIAAQDARGNPVAGFTDLVTIAIGANPGGSVLNGTTAQNAVGGVVQFADLRLDQPGDQYTLEAATPNLPVVISPPFDVRAAPATVYWSNAAGGLWSTAANWSTGVVPSSADHAVINVAGTYTVTLDVDATFAGLSVGGSSGTQTLVVPGHTVTLNGAGTVNANGALQVNGGIVAGTGVLTNNGVVQLYSGTLESPLALRNEALLTIHGFSYVNGPLTTVAGSTLRMEADYASYYYSYATVRDGFTNNGTIELTTINGPGAGSLTVPNGTLVNARGASINVLAGTGGARQLDLQLDNQGSMNIGIATTLQRTVTGTAHVNTGTIDVNGNLTVYQAYTPATFTNSGTGTIMVAAGDTLKVSYGEFHYDAGTVGGAGTIAFESATFVVGNQGFNNATTDLVLNRATVGGPGVLTNVVGKTLIVNASTIIAPLDNQGLLTVQGYSYLNGPLTTTPGSMLRLEADYSTYYFSYLTVESGFTNRGTIELTSINGAGSASLVVQTGTMVNAAGAALNVLAGTGGTRQLDLELDNQGAMTIGTATTLQRSVSGTAHTNSGSIDVSANLTLYQGYTPATLTNTGSITVAADDTLKVSYGEFHYDAGRLDGAGTVAFEYATFVIGDQGFSNSVTSLALNGATVNGPGTLTNVAGKNLVVNASTVNAPLDNQGLLTLRGYINNLNGVLTTAVGSRLRLEADAASAYYSYVTVESGFSNNGTIELTSINGSAPASLTVKTGTLVN
ncbi:MAG TPA: Ig-like domain-containing protein, partial [Gemmatimonadales bacterium]|nr:Ig-like domain-containing protein [Gemmatimonadales bacterium]